MSRTLSAQGVKPAPWNATYGLVAPEGRSLWHGLLAYYPMWEGGGTTFRDPVGHHHGTLSSGTLADTGWVSGPRGRRFYLDNAINTSDNRIECGVLDLSGASQITLFADFEFVDQSNGDGTVRVISIRYSGGDDFRVILLNHDTATPTPRLDFDDGSFTAISAPTINADERHTVVGTYDGTTVRFYMDGLLVGTSVESVDVSGAEGTLHFGHNPGGTDHAHMRLNAGGVWTRALTQQEVVSLHADPELPVRMHRREAYLVPAAGGGNEQISATLAGTSQDSVGSIILNLTGTTTLAGTSLDSATASLEEQIAATLAGTSLDSGTIRALAVLSATLAGTSLDSGVVSLRERLTASLAGTSLDSGTITLAGAIVQIAATLAGTSSDSATASLQERLAATLAGTSLDSGTISLVGAIVQIAATLEGTSLDSASASLQERLSATLAGTSFDSATVAKLEHIAATLGGTSLDSGAITAQGGGSLGPLPNTFTTYRAAGNREDLGGPRHEGYISRRAADTIARQIAELLEDR